MVKLQNVLYLLLFLIISCLLTFHQENHANAFSPIYERQEIIDPDKDWKFWSLDKDANETIYGKNNEVIDIRVGNEDTCKLKIGNPPEIRSVSYMSNGERLDLTVWLSSKINEINLVENKIDIENYQDDIFKPLWKKAKYTVAIDINSVFNQGTDYRVEFLYDKINSTVPKWTEVIYEISAFRRRKDNRNQSI